MTSHGKTPVDMMKGGGYGFPSKPPLGTKNTFEPVSYSGCVKQSGGSKNIHNTVSFNNQTTDPGYGYVSGEYNELFLGSGYPEMTATTNSCKKGGTKQKRKTYRKKHKKHKKHKKTRGKKHVKTRAKTRAKTYKKRKTGIRKKKKRKTQRGGYSQYQSNVALTNTMQTPSITGGWTGQLSMPPPFKAINNCKDNYNHFKQNKAL